jgi:hypothetical protein
VKRLTAAVAIAAAASCSPAKPTATPTPTPIAAAPVEEISPEPSASAAAKPAPSPEPTEEEKAIAEVLAQVAHAHGLDVLHPVPGNVVGRDEGIRLIMQKTEKDVPKAALEADGEINAAFGLMPADYPFVAGMYDMVKANIAGFYDPDDGKMYLLDDLDDFNRDQTLAHELVHALQDQHWTLASRVKYKRGTMDKLNATSCMAEGDAMSAMFDVRPQAARLSAEALHFMMTASVAISPTGATTPRALQASLIAPYVDGYRFIEALRDRGGWAEVNRAWANAPISTEQVLHIARYDAGEKPLDVAEPTASALGAEWRLLDGDVAGEQGTRIAFEQWGTRKQAADAAEGWGGDRYAAFVRDATEGRDVAAAWIVRFDNVDEANEAAAHIRRTIKPCSERKPLGPLAWQQKKDTIAIVGGPYHRDGAGKAQPVATANCALAKKWLADLLR